jgi:alkyl hydroperoxide reductase subunit AhpF
MDKKLFETFTYRKCYVCARVLEKLEVSAIVNIDKIEEHYCLSCHVFSFHIHPVVYSVPKVKITNDQILALFENLKHE